MRKFFILSLLSLLLPIATRAQQQWSLEDCICYALNNNLSIKTQALNIASNRLVKDKARLDYLPSMDFNSNYQFSLGRSLDPTTYSFIENSTVNTIGTGLSIGTTLFDGMKRYYAYRKSIADLDIAVADLEMTRNDVSLSVVMAYMNILLNREVMESVERQIEISETNINRTKIMVEEGVMTDDKLQNLLIQYNNEQYSMAEAAGNLRKSIIGLCSLLNIDDYDTFDIKADTSFAIIPAVPLEDVIAAVGGLPQMESARKKIKSAEYAVRITKGDVFPRISFGAAMASSWSDARRRPLLDGAGNAVIIASGLQYRDYPFLSQLNDNRNSYI
jgi:outer membrane protein